MDYGFVVTGWRDVSTAWCVDRGTGEIFVGSTGGLPPDIRVR